ncbi:MAG: hypothetical protein A3J63_02865 [Candidatus Moranbacteria bacterium RIFCSPHIGHO2_02_FULL_40_12b]|nr:MAG: hypothetical protein A3J63_02865 [Candidatus Moranbacteria bacterium RIFCSPHIGHO2_02_FULL_40_12b]
MNFNEFIKFAKKNVRYIIAAAVFLLAIFYSQLIPEVPKIKKNKFVSYQSGWKNEKAEEFAIYAYYFLAMAVFMGIYEIRKDSDSSKL